MATLKRILSVFGTRPEVIKMAPIVRALAEDRNFDAKVCVTGQHRQMLDQVMGLFEITPDFDLDIMKQGQSLTDISARTMLGLADVLTQYRPDFVLVQGDTTTAMASAITSFYHRVKVGHVEAGLRTGDLYSPWPEEANRRLIGILTHFHFAPTHAAKENLFREGVPPSQVFVTGNTVVDALLSVVERISGSGELQAQCRAGLPERLDSNKRLIVVTGHRRENFGAGLERVFSSIAAIAKREDVQILYPVHLNPNVRNPAQEILSGIDNVFLIGPLDYLTFVYVMMQAYFIITDSGGIQEEAPILGKPLLITRENTERPEAVHAGTGILVGTDSQRIVTEAMKLLDDQDTYAVMSRKHNTLGNGYAAKHIVRVLQDV